MSVVKILYISQTGLTEPLGESQVLQYVIALSQKNKMSVLSFEKPTKIENYTVMKKRLMEYEVDWHYYSYSNRFGLLSTGTQMLAALFYMFKKVRKESISIIHARSLIPAVMGMVIKKITGVKLLFDIRGFAIDEKILAKRLSEKSFLTRFLKMIERKVYKNADHVVTLTQASQSIITEQYNIIPEKISVIPTCVNHQLFYSMPPEEKATFRKSLGFSENDFIILRNGSLNECYDCDAEFSLFNALSHTDKKIKYLILNNGQFPLIQKYFEKYPILKKQSTVLSVHFDQIAKYINICNLCLFFVKPVFAKKASAPTKFAELVACHIYSITNKGYGDAEFYFEHYHVGTLVDLPTTDDTRENVLKTMTAIIQKYQAGEECMRSNDFLALLHDHFSIDIAINKYQKIYDMLCCVLRTRYQTD